MEKAILNVDNLYITQGMNNAFSHLNDLAIDIAILTYLKAPFTGVIKRIYNNCNAVWLESIDKVEYADGSIDYMTVMTLHDSDISDLYVGKRVNQGEIYYQPGTKGYVTGSHIHIAIGRGKFIGNGWYQNNDGNWCIHNQYDITKGLFLYSGTKVSNNIYNWVKTDYQINNLKSLDDIARDVINGKYRNQPERQLRLEREGYNYKEVQARVNELMNNRVVKYTVKSGDTLINIANNYHLDWKKLYEDNKKIIGSNPNLIYPGQQLIIKI